MNASANSRPAPTPSAGPAVDRLSANERAIFVRWVAAATLTSVLEELEAERSVTSDTERDVVRQAAAR